MGYRSEVRLLMGPKAYELLKANCRNSTDKIAKNTLKDVEMETDIVYYNKALYEHEDAVYIKWHDVKWYDSYEDVKIVMRTLNELDTIVTNEEEILDEYFYKFMKIGEDGESIEYTNDEMEEFTEGYYIVHGFSED